MSARERVLALGFVTILVLGGAVLAVVQLRAWKDRVDNAEYDLQLRMTEAEILLSQKEDWLERAAWIEAQQPPFTTRRDAETDLLTLIDSSTASMNVQVQQKQPLEPIDMQGFFAATMTVRLRAGFEETMSWIYELQQPGAFISIPSISIIPNEEDQSQLNVGVVVQKWYRRDEI